MKGYKCLTWDYRPPVQGGEPLFDGNLPFTLPKRECDPGPAECSYGWNFTERPEQALLIAGLWPTGQPIRLFEIEADGMVVRREEKCRANQLRLVAEADMESALRAFSASFTPHVEEMAAEQLTWWRALSRPTRDITAVKRGLEKALDHRGLKWSLRPFADARAAWAASAAWAAWASRAAWAASSAWDASSTRAARDAWDASSTRAAWAASAAWDASSTRAAWAALSVCFASRQGWIEHPADLLTIGIRDAYTAGLNIVIPTGLNELGWAMVPK